MQPKGIKVIIFTSLLLFASQVFSQEIFTAIMQGNIEKVEQLVEADSTNVLIKHARGFSPIHFAANFNQLEILKLLIENGADVSEQGPNDRQPIHWAAATKSIDALKWLHKTGADLNCKDATNKTPLYLAVTRQQKENINYLLSQKVNIQMEGRSGFELLYFSITGNYITIVQKFLESDFDFKQLAVDGSDLMLAAAQSGNPDMISTFHNLGLDLNQRNDFGEAPVHISITQKNLDVLKKLLELGVDINLTNYVGQNALSMAIENDSTEYANFLKSKGAVQVSPLKLKMEYPGFELPNLEPKLLAPGLISTPNMNERDVMFSPEMNEFYFSRHSAAIRMPMTIKKMTKTDQLWSNPETAKFSGKYSDGECFITSDNKNLYLISKRPHDGTQNPSNWEIWLADRVKGDWENFRLFDTLNLKGCFYPSLTKDNELLYTSADNNLFLAKLNNGKIEKTIKLGKEINTETAEYNAMISPNGDYIIFTSHGFEDHYGNGDLYISFRNKDKLWMPAINMGPSINSEALEYCPNISPDGKYFFFTSNKKGTEDIYWINAAIIDQLREKSFSQE
jgi:ankyrin repeat protein